VFISRKLNRWGNRFGFVRFNDGKNVSKLETELDSIHISSMKLFANLSRDRKFFNKLSLFHRYTRLSKQTNLVKLLSIGK